MDTKAPVGINVDNGSKNACCPVEELHIYTRKAEHVSTISLDVRPNRKGVEHWDRGTHSSIFLRGRVLTRPVYPVD
ncbi:pentatricopeptide repeat-containing protein, putative [Anopheles sinensis]|uniref:Pentatricopeptide repeat-containing protein, putative n=1 Tax=Anopheles sinensis TaxID=74873 RepID=A0A084VUA0_ANOSI|nr:pentatricopeptide repeat-containing protein, putative [Anopheles sinensis]